MQESVFVEVMKDLVKTLSTTPEKTEEVMEIKSRVLAMV